MQGIAQAIAFHGNKVKSAVLQHINAKQRMPWFNLFSASSNAIKHCHGLENTTVSEILKNKSNNDAGVVYCCHTNDTVFDAVKNMIENNIGALVVMEPGAQNQVAGIITERDYLRKIIVQGRCSTATKVGDIMTDQKKLVTVSSDTNILKAMQLMTEKGIRHVPVIDEKVVGMISMVDVVGAAVEQQKEEVKRLNAFIKGDYY